MAESLEPTTSAVLSRRTLLKGAMAAGAVVAAEATAAEGKGGGVNAVKNGRIKQSVAFWCFNTAGDKWDVKKTAEITRSLGCASVELVEPKDWKILQDFGLICAIAPNGMPGAPFMKGFNNPRYHEEVVTRTKKAIDDCAVAKYPNVIAFTGYKWRDADDPKSGEMSREEGADNCVRALKEVARHAEAKNVSVCLEQLNTRDKSHPMKGHPGYQGDDLDYVADIVRRVGSTRVQLLFDIYHVQVMNGDVIRRIDQYKDLIGHVHTAGCPGRGELDDRQEINYPAVMKKLLDIGYAGHVGQEYIPTRDATAGLREAVRVCDV